MFVRALMPFIAVSPPMFRADLVNTPMELAQRHSKEKDHSLWHGTLSYRIAVRSPQRLNINSSKNPKFKKKH
ncbi:hypothetical protein JCM19238_1586 [Vibrio ponticus]|nr:hypothetical protein JCM19238_1586 [Vibrio ponticus]